MATSTRTNRYPLGEALSIESEFSRKPGDILFQRPVRISHLMFFSVYRVSINGDSTLVHAGSVVLEWL